MSRKVDIAKFSFIRSFKIKHWQYLPFPSVLQKTKYAEVQLDIFSS